ncbi:MAG: polymerase sigma-70 factor, subfamily [Blastococcus sp.]|jgi:RNA polymerase sigma-70 factor (ECF subfamily)|nr:polymerase sigma-70 factor, subfamily [Blastococcus sp.]
MTALRDDRELLAAHVRGDPAAFGELYDRHRNRLWAVALRTTGDREDAADALQDALIAAFRRADTYRGDAAVTTWLHRIVVNACLDRLRRKKVRATDPLPSDLDSRTEATSAFGPAGRSHRAITDPADLAVDDEDRLTVLAALDTLPPDQRAALVLVDMQGYSVEETAAILECAPGTVKSRCSRGRRRLAPLLAALAPPSRAPARNPAGPPRVPPTGELLLPGEPRRRPRHADKPADGQGGDER